MRAVDGAGVVAPRNAEQPRFSPALGDSDILIPSAVVDTLLARLRVILARFPGATELVLNRPGRVLVEVKGEWFTVDEPALTSEWVQGLAVSLGRYSNQQINTTKPIMSVPLPGGERLQIVLPPAVEPGFASLTLRLPSSTIRTLDEYEKDGYFERYAWGFDPQTFAARRGELRHDDIGLIEALRARDLNAFFKLALLARKNIAVVGETGSGKTTLMKTLCQSIPSDERLITIEDVRELQLPLHDNKVHMLYSKGGQGQANIGAGTLVEATLRMKPSRVLLAELRGDEAYDFLELLTTGHSGSVTSFHAESCGLARWRFASMCLGHPKAKVLGLTALREMVDLTMHVIVHVVCEVLRDSEGRPTGEVARYIDQIHFDPFQRLGAEIGAGAVMQIQGEAA